MSQKVVDFFLTIAMSLFLGKYPEIFKFSHSDYL